MEEKNQRKKIKEKNGKKKSPKGCKTITLTTTSPKGMYLGHFLKKRKEGEKKVV
jgi:hypothetical protein